MSGDASKPGTHSLSWTREDIAFFNRLVKVPVVPGLGRAVSIFRHHVHASLLPSLAENLSEGTLIDILDEAESKMWPEWLAEGLADRLDDLPRVEWVLTGCWARGEIARALGSGKGTCRTETALRALAHGIALKGALRGIFQMIHRVA